MRARWQLKVGLPLGVAFVAVALAGVVAFACTSLASLNLSQATGAPGSQVTVTGSSFNPSAKPDADGTFTPVTLHWNSVNGPVLADNVVPDATGSIGPLQVTIPSDAKPGYYMVIATQQQLTGGSGEAFGTPARAGFQVTPASGAPAQQSLGTGQTAPVASTSSTSGVGVGMIALLAVLGVAGVTLFAVGSATFLGANRRSAAASRARKS